MKITKHRNQKVTITLEKNERVIMNGLALSGWLTAFDEMIEAEKKGQKFTVQYKQEIMDLADKFKNIL
jgi:hypothetical protein